MQQIKIGCYFIDSIMKQPIWNEYVEKALTDAHGRVCAKPTYILNAINDGTLPVDVIIDLPLLPPGMDADAIARSLVKDVLSRRRQAAEWTKAKIAALAVVVAAAITAAFAVLG